MVSLSDHSPQKLVPVMLVVMVLAAGNAHAQDLATAEESIDRAIAYLALEVPAWRKENGCFSCHNNGDGARVLYLARRLGRDVDPQALAQTDAWLQSPGDWQTAGREESGDSGAKLATIQFSAALLESIRSQDRPGRRDDDRKRLQDAARLVAESQDDDGAWSIGAPGSLGAPATYGRFLATATALHFLEASGDPQLQSRIANAESWLRTQQPRSVLDAAATILGLAGAEDRPAVAQRRRCVDLLRAAQQEDGGWGPFSNSPPEPFDTAIALIALSSIPGDHSTRDTIDRGRRYLLATEHGGSWTETTRPAGAVSYAQHISTTAWALQALLVTQTNDRAGSRDCLEEREKVLKRAQ
jgi:hypothetical protein